MMTSSITVVCGADPGSVLVTNEVRCRFSHVSTLLCLFSQYEDDLHLQDPSNHLTHLVSLVCSHLHCPANKLSQFFIKYF